MVEHI